MLLEQDFLPKDSKPYWGETFKNGTADSITIHWIGAFPFQTPTVVRNYWLESGGEVSTHFIVKDGLVLQCMPISKCCYHTGNLVGNRTSLGIEVIPQTKEGEFSIFTMNTLRELLAILPPLPLLRHYDWSGKNCPAFYTDEERWERLKDYLTLDR